MDRKKFLDFMDMVDGGGAGKTGDKFQGGGLFSALANAVATPYGSEDDERMKAMMERRMSAGLIDRPQAPAPQVVRSAPTPAPTPAQPSDYPNMSMPAIEGYTTPQQPSGYPSMNMPAIEGYTTPSSGYPNMGMPAIEGYTTPQSGYPDMGMPSVEGYTTPMRPNQIVPTMSELSVPQIAELAQSPRYSPTFASDYRDYLEYLNTGRYPRG